MPSTSGSAPVARTPSIHVPWLEPRSSIVATAPSTTNIACRRETLGSSRRIAHV
jgi:hypothetical protein